MFKRSFEISLHRVHGELTVREGEDKLKLYVDGDAMRMVAGLSQAQKLLQKLTNESTEEETKGAALYFASVIFGEKQAEELLNFYRGDAGCVINVCGQYFSGKLASLITAAQKKK